jgi:heme ABC exporter ATP-binding subunit CcmA
MKGQAAEGRDLDTLDALDTREPVGPQSLRLPAEQQKNNLVELRGLKKTYTFKPILRGLDLTVARGERVALLGANGAGKTTLLRILACLTKPSAGSALVAGLDCARDAQQVRHLVGFVAHQPYLYEELTALENLLFFARMYSVPHAHQQAIELLRRVGLERRQHERVGTFSRGQVQRLSWARALLYAPSLLLLDEPDTGLDQSGRELIDSFLAEHTDRGGSSLLITHQLERALQLSDHIVLLAAGRIVYRQETAQLTLEELQQHYQEVVR